MPGSTRGNGELEVSRGVNTENVARSRGLAVAVRNEGAALQWLRSGKFSLCEAGVRGSETVAREEGGLPLVMGAASHSAAPASTLFLCCGSGQII